MASIKLGEMAPDGIVKFKLGDLNAVRHTRTYVNYYWRQGLNLAIFLKSPKHQIKTSPKVFCCLDSLFVSVQLYYVQGFS